MTRSLPMLLALTLSALTLGVPPALAQDGQAPTQQKAPGRRTVTVSTQGVDIGLDAFAAAVLDGDNYPMSASYMGVPALLECRTLGRQADGSVVIYQRTGGNMLVSPRHYVIALKVTRRTDSEVVVGWDLVPHQRVDGQFTGPYAAALNAHPEAVYTPINTGYWAYDRAKGTVTYSAASDPGGSIPDWMVSESAAMAFPRELLRVKWGIQT